MPRIRTKSTVSICKLSTFCGMKKVTSILLRRARTVLHKSNPFISGIAISSNTFSDHKLCDFLQEDGNCKLGNCKLDSCKKYPYTDQPERLCSLLGMLDTVSICPVAFEMFERLKKEYGFKRR